MSKEDALAEARALLYSTAAVPPGSHLRHNGRIYMNSAFPPLLRKAEMYENVKFLVGEHAAVLVAWFVQRGLCTDPGTLPALLEGIAKRPAR